MSSTYRVLHINVLFSMLCLINKCSRYIRKCSVAKHDMGVHSSNPYDGL